MRDYLSFISGKHKVHADSGFICDPATLPPSLFDWQREIATWSLRKGQSALFEDCGLGKTAQQLAWADAVCRRTNGNVLILAPLAVSSQTAAEGEKFDIAVNVAREARDIRPGINVTNYERLHLFDPARFVGVVLDESSILKSFMGKTKRSLVEAFKQTPYRLCCTATPAPNDTVELGNHAEFLGVMDPGDMLTRFFINDTSAANKMRLKAHAVGPFWQWVASWAVCLTKPSDIGYSDAGFVLPELSHFQHTVNGPEHDFANGMLIHVADLSATTIHAEMRKTLAARADQAVELIWNYPGEPVIIWVNTDAEEEAITRRDPEAVPVRGSMRPEIKEERLTAFSRGELKTLVTKPSIAGFGLNWQHCRVSISVGQTYSFEMRYQALRRLWRFGQQREVHDHVIMGPQETKIYNAVLAKQAKHENMATQMVGLMNSSSGIDDRLELESYVPQNSIHVPSWLQ